MTADISIAVFMQATFESSKVAFTYLERSNWNVWDALALWRADRMV